MGKPLIAISTGDPAGIGPEICVRALNEPDLVQACRPLIICDPWVIQKACRDFGIDLHVHVVQSPEEGLYSFGTIDVLEMNHVDPDALTAGKVSAICGAASYEYVRKAITLTMQKKVMATVTGPINKESLHEAGIPFPGHTEIFAHHTGAGNVAMMLADGAFRVVHVSTHVSMLDAISAVTAERISNVIKLADSALKDMGVPSPRIAVNGLNPHAGENGLFGREEIEHIIPAIREARAAGIDADGPHPPDTVFPKMKGGQYDIVVCMYHDQGHIPVKLAGFTYNHGSQVWEGMSGVNITLGLPIIRVSVDHGTAFDKAWTGSANPGSMVQALYHAIQLSKKNNLKS